MGMGGTRPGGEGGPLGMSAKGSTGVGLAGGLGNEGSRSKKYEATQLGRPSQHPAPDWGSVAGHRRRKGMSSLGND